MRKNVLAKRMQALWKSGQLCDMILISGQARVSCHRCVIGASSRSLLNEIAMEPWDMRSLWAIEFADTYHEQALLIVVEHMYGELCGPKLQNLELMCLVDVCCLAAICRLRHLSGLVARSLSKFLTDLDIDSLQQILRKMSVVEPTHRKYVKIGRLCASYDIASRGLA